MPACKHLDYNGRIGSDLTSNGIAATGLANDRLSASFLLASDVRPVHNQGSRTRRECLESFTAKVP